MLQPLPVLRLIHLLIICLSLVCSLNAITQQCSQQNSTQLAPIIMQDTTPCPANSKCTQQGFCVCDAGYFGNCQTKGEYIDSQSKLFNITENYTFFIIEPIIDEFVNFQFVICNSNSLDNTEILNLWVDDGTLVSPYQQNPLGRDKQLRVSQGCMALITSYFTFELQPNGQKQLLILGLKLRNPGSLTVEILVQQISIFGFDVILKIIMVLIGGIAVISLGGILYCIYKCRRRGRRANLHEEKFDISFFDEYMPAKKANLQEIKEEICSVCLGEYKQNEEIRPTVCGHYFHKSCLDEWCVTNLSCPICRTSFQKANLIHEQFLISRRSSTRENESIGEGIINREDDDIRQPIV